MLVYSQTNTHGKYVRLPDRCDTGTYTALTVRELTYVYNNDRTHDHQLDNEYYDATRCRTFGFSQTSSFLTCLDRTCGVRVARATDGGYLFLATDDQRRCCFGRSESRRTQFMQWKCFT